MEIKGKSLQNNLNRLDWFLDAKFGLFIHWGAYSVAGVEASWPIMAPDISEVMFKNDTGISLKEYEALPNKFNPVDFDPEEWVRMAKNAGMKYIIITAKHHDGFCMFDAPGTDYKITNTPYGKDVCLELSKACAKLDMRLGFYYSPPDMNHPGYRNMTKPATKNWLGEPKRNNWAGYLDYMESHLRKLLTDYGEVSVLWFDGLVSHGKYDPQRFHNLIHELSPNTLINDRLGDGYDYVTPEQFIPTDGIPAKTGKPPSGMDPGGDGFFKAVLFLFKIPGIRGFLKKQMEKYADGTLELSPVFLEPYPSPDRFQAWETCMTMGQSWGYNPNETVWKTPKQLIQNLIEVVSRGGNYLLNVGPTDKGEYPPEAKERLTHIGKWMDRHQETIYGSTYTPLQGQAWGQATRKDNKVYLHIFDWPSDGRIEIETFPGMVKKAGLMNGKSLDFSQKDHRLNIMLPVQAHDPDVTVLELEIDEKEKIWEKYSPETITTTLTGKYLKAQVVGSTWINTLLNGLIAFFSYRSREIIPVDEVGVDILITVGIISFLVSWISIGGTRGEIAKGNLSKSAIRSPKLPKGSASRALIIMLGCVVVFGGLIVVGINLTGLSGFSNWAYIGIKTLYTGVAAGLAAGLGVYSMLGDQNRK